MLILHFVTCNGIELLGKILKIDVDSSNDVNGNFGTLILKGDYKRLFYYFIRLIQYNYLYSLEDL
jgi:hypothetical protein